LVKSLSSFEKPFDENADENLSAVVHFQCRIFERLTFKLQNNLIVWRLLSNWWCSCEQSDTNS